MRYRLAMGLALLASAAGAAAQSNSADPAAGRGRSVDDYLCAFAGKCAASDANGPSLAAPATKGFRLAAPEAAHGQPAQGQPAKSQPATARVTPAHRGAAVARTARGPVVAASAPVPAGTRANLLLTFTKGSDQMTDVARQNATAFATALKTPDLQAKRFLIEGHTDARGSRAGNLDLSRRRAEAVVDFLVARGVDRSRLSASGVGSSKPLPETPATAPSNRRVEAVLLS